MKRSIWIAAGVVVLVIVLAGAAYMAGRLLNPAAQNGGATSGMRISVPGEGGGMIEAQLEKADEIPDERPDALGFFARREDNSVFINETTGNGFRIAVGEDGDISTNAGEEETEVVVTSDTLVYVDATTENIDDSQDGGVVKQTLKPGSLDEISQYSVVMAWGEKRGDRVVASVLLYTPPPVIER